MSELETRIRNAVNRGENTYLDDYKDEGPREDFITREVMNVLNLESRVAEWVREAAHELLTVAQLRGDNVPHPAIDPKGWTARMQTAWNELERALSAKPEVLRCKHDRLDEDGICRNCGADCRRGGI